MGDSSRRSGNCVAPQLPRLVNKADNLRNGAGGRDGLSGLTPVPERAELATSFGATHARASSVRGRAAGAETRAAQYRAVEPARASLARAGGCPGAAVRVLPPLLASMAERPHGGCYEWLVGKGRGGARCRHESPDAHPGSAIAGLNADWVSPHLLAMSRPWQARLESGALDLLVAHGVRTVLNAQERGEHPHCGAPLLPGTGLTYDPETLAAAGVAPVDCGWRDMTNPPSLEHVAGVCRAVHRAVVLEGGRVAVHCHAGRGRTGLLIACLLCTLYGISAAEAIAHTRSRRRRAVQRARQERFCAEFEVLLRRERAAGAAWAGPHFAAGDLGGFATPGRRAGGGGVLARSLPR